MNVQDQILNFLSVTGPTTPTKVAKNIKTEIFLASAHLSDLASRGKVKISNLKVGESPLYYLPGQEEQLYSFAAGNINLKDLSVLERLKSRKIMRESELDLLSKVALRSLKDFAVPLNVNFSERTELFWKWHLFSSEETNEIIGSMLNNPAPQEKQEENKKENQQDAWQATPEAGIIRETEEKHISEDKEKYIDLEVSEGRIAVKKEQLAARKKEEQKKLGETPIERLSTPKKTKEKMEKMYIKKPAVISDEFLPRLETYFRNLEIDIEDKEIIRKNSEINLLVRVTSAIGKMKYFCKAKNKKRCDEKDISSAYMEAQMKKLPLLFICTSEISKKAQVMLNSGAFENMILTRI